VGGDKRFITREKGGSIWPEKKRLGNEGLPPKKGEILQSENV